jgi:hypothetical protein
MAPVEIWEYRTQVEVESIDPTGFDVEAVDGHVGKVTEASNELGASWLVVETGLPVVGKKILLPAGIIEEVDPEQSQIRVDRTRDEVLAAPEHDPSGYRDQELRLALADYYAGLYG